MGLDLYHLYASEEMTDESVTIDPEAPEIAVRKKFFRRAMEEYIDREGNFGEQEVDVVYFRKVGYQRKGVSAEFYRIFPPDVITADFSTVAMIRDLTDPELVESFSRNFMDNWDDRRSILMVSW